MSDVKWGDLVCTLCRLVGKEKKAVGKYYSEDLSKTIYVCEECLKSTTHKVEMLGSCSNKRGGNKNDNS